MSRSRRLPITKAIAWSGWSVAVALSFAAMANSLAFGRIPLQALVMAWPTSATLMTLSAAATVWWLGYGLLLLRAKGGLTSADALIPGAPLVLGATLPLVLIYLSDQANHYFYYWMIDLAQARSLALLSLLIMACIVLQWTRIRAVAERSSGRSLQQVVAEVAEPLSLVALLEIGLLQSASYLGHLGNDFLRYWAIADAFLAGAGYPAVPTDTSYVEAGMTSYIVDLPLFSVLLAASFRLFGHVAAACYVPIVLPGLLLPLVTYLLFREVLGNRPVAYSLAVFAVTFPPLRFYTLNWTVPDALFITFLMAAAWLLAMLIRRKGGAWTWGLLGLAVACVALSRPEGVAYASVYGVVAGLQRASMRRKLAAAVAFFLPVGLFSLIMLSAYGYPWPRSLAGTMRPSGILANWQVLERGTLEYFASAIRLSVPELLAWSAVLAVLALVGCWPGLHKRPWMAAIIAPAWINLAAVLMVDPRVSGARLWHDFFRHISYPLPLLFLGAGVALLSVTRLSCRRSDRMLLLLAVNLILLFAVLWNVHLLSKPSWSFGADAGNLLGAGRVNLADIVLNRYELPTLGFANSGGHPAASTPAEFIHRYPDQINEFFSQYDAVRRTSGTPYQSGTLLLYLFGLAISLTHLAEDAGRKAVGRLDG